MNMDDPLDYKFPKRVSVDEILAEALKFAEVKKPHKTFRYSEEQYEFVKKLRDAELSWEEVDRYFSRAFPAVQRKRSTLREAFNEYKKSPI